MRYACVSKNCPIFFFFAPIYNNFEQPFLGWISFKFGTLIRHILAHLYLKFGDVLTQCEGGINDYIAKSGSKTLITNGSYGLVIFSRGYPFIKSGLSWSILESV